MKLGVTIVGCTVYGSESALLRPRIRLRQSGERSHINDRDPPLILLRDHPGVGELAKLPTKRLWRRGQERSDVLLCQWQRDVDGASRPWRRRER